MTGQAYCLFENNSGNNWCFRGAFEGIIGSILEHCGDNWRNLEHNWRNLEHNLLKVKHGAMSVGKERKHPKIV